ncbi:MAG: hypothetical protein ABGZ17_17130, partial [Planctomycetaceae bacterium]
MGRFQQSWTLNGVLMLVISTTLVAAEFEVDDVMYTDPVLPKQPMKLVFSKSFKKLWVQALRQPQTELQLRAASTIGIAHTKGMPELIDTAADLVKVMEAAGQDPLVKIAAARTLVILQSKANAEALMRHARDGKSMARTVEPALGRWRHQPVLDVWKTRIQQATDPRES